MFTAYSHAHIYTQYTANTNTPSHITICLVCLLHECLHFWRVVVVNVVKVGTSVQIMRKGATTIIFRRFALDEWKKCERQFLHTHTHPCTVQSRSQFNVCVSFVKRFFFLFSILCNGTMKLKFYCKVIVCDIYDVLFPSVIIFSIQLSQQNTLIHSHVFHIVVVLNV